MNNVLPNEGITMIMLTTQHPDSSVTTLIYRAPPVARLLLEMLCGTPIAETYASAEDVTQARSQPQLGVLMINGDQV